METRTARAAGEHGQKVERGGIGVIESTDRPAERDAAKLGGKFAAKFPALNLMTIKDFGGWQAAHARFFADGGVFDKIYQPG